MVRTQIQLTEAQADALRREAAGRGVSMAEIIRAAVDAHLAGGGASVRERALRAIGGFRSGRADVSENHDDHLADAFEA